MVNDDLQSLGQILRQARESRALSLEEVELQTRIRVKYLQALERGDLGTMPSNAHAKGFLRNYAQFLRLDANAIVAQFALMTGTGHQSITTSTATPYHNVPPPPVPSAPRLSEITSGAVPSPPASSPSSQPTGAERSAYVAPAQRVGPAAPLGMGGTVPAQPRQVAVPQPEQQRSAPARILRSNIFAAVILVAAAVVIVWWANTQLSQFSVEDIVPTAEQSDILRTAQARNNVTPSPTFRPTSTPVVDTGPLPLDRVLLTISVEQRSWTRIVVDGVMVFEGQAEPGTVLQYEGRESILVLTGNGAGLVVTYNRQYIGPLGERGEVIERLFTPTGQITPTPTPSITPTPTSVPSPTPSATPTP